MVNDKDYNELEKEETNLRTLFPQPAIGAEFR